MSPAMAATDAMQAGMNERRKICGLVARNR